MLSELRQKNTPNNFNYMWNMRQKQTENKNKFMEADNRLVVIRGKEV